MDLKVLAVAIACLGFSACRHSGGDELGIKIELEAKKLSNGLVVLMAEDHTVPIVSYQSWFRVGSVDEHPGITGISHLFEHLMFKGTPKYPEKAFFEQLEAKGADVNAYTMRDYTVYHEDFVPSLLPKVIEMESDRMANLILDADTLNTERQVVFEERRLRTENSPSGRMQEALWALAYRTHPYTWPVVGYPEDLLKISVKDLQEYFQAHYQPANEVIVVVGDFNTKETFKLIEQAYSPITRRAKPKRNIPAEPEQKEERLFTMYDDVASQSFAHAYHVSDAEDDDSYALDVLANILFEGHHSRAYRRLIEEKDELASIVGSAYTPTYPGLFMISGTMKGELPIDMAQKDLAALIKEAQDTDVTGEEIQIAVKQLTVQLVDSVRTTHGLAQLLGLVTTILGDPGKYADDLAKYTKITAADVKRVANKYLQPNNRSVVVMLPIALKPKGASK